MFSSCLTDKESSSTKTDIDVMFKRRNKGLLSSVSVSISISQLSQEINVSSSRLLIQCPAVVQQQL